MSQVQSQIMKLLPTYILGLIFLSTAIGCDKSNRFLINTKTVIFLDAIEGNEYVTKSGFINRMSKLDISLRLEDDLSNMTLDDCLKEYNLYHKKQFRNWSSRDKKFIIKHLSSAYAKICETTPDVLPDTLYFIRTTGNQEFNSFFTSRNAIVCPSTIRLSSSYLFFSKYVRNYMEQLFIHEIFHIYSARHPSIREHLYEAIGFKKIHCFNIASELKEKLISNPDDKPGFYKITLKQIATGEERDYCMLLLSKYSKWEGYIDFPARINVLLVYLDVRLHEIEFNGNCWESSYDSCYLPIIKSSNEFENSHWSTDLVKGTISPEEIIAIMFVELINSKYDNKILINKSEEYLAMLNNIERILIK